MRRTQQADCANGTESLVIHNTHGTISYMMKDQFRGRLCRLGELPVSFKSKLDPILIDRDAVGFLTLGGPRIRDVQHAVLH